MSPDDEICHDLYTQIIHKYTLHKREDQRVARDISEIESSCQGAQIISSIVES